MTEIGGVLGCAESEFSQEYSPISEKRCFILPIRKWVVPLGLGIGQIMKLGKLPVNIQLASFYNVVRPDDASRWQIRAQLVLMFPK